MDNDPGTVSLHRSVVRDSSSCIVVASSHYRVPALGKDQDHPSGEAGGEAEIRNILSQEDTS